MSRTALMVSLVLCLTALAALVGCGGEHGAPPLGAARAADAPAAWPGKIAFLSDRTPNGVYVMHPDGTGQVPVPNTKEGDAVPSWSSNGAKLVFVTGERNVCRINADGTGRKQLTHSNLREEGASWSPAGSQIAFNRDSADLSQSHIWVMKSDGTAQTQLTKGAVQDFDPAWSPSGEKIVFERSKPPSDTSCLYIMEADGTGVTPLTTVAAGADDNYPVWAPDGSLIAFSRGPAFSAKIYVIKPDGTGLKQLTKGTAWDLEPTWSPDSTKIAFTRYPPGYPASGKSDIWVMRASDGAILLQLTNNSANDGEACWSRP